MLEFVIWKLLPVPTRFVNAASEYQFIALAVDVELILGKLEPEHH